MLKRRAGLATSLAPLPPPPVPFRVHRPPIVVTLWQLQPQFWSLDFWSFGVLEFWSFGFLDFWIHRRRKCANQRRNTEQRGIDS